jgi:hypothetical protein
LTTKIFNLLKEITYFPIIATILSYLIKVIIVPLHI